MDQETEKEKKKRRARVPFTEKLAYVDRQIAYFERKVAEHKAIRAEMVAAKKAEADQIMKDIG